MNAGPGICNSPGSANSLPLPLQRLETYRYTIMPGNPNLSFVVVPLSFDFSKVRP